MDQQTTYHGFWPAPMRALAQVSEWMDWMRPTLYCLLAVAVTGLVLALLDMAVLCWKEFHASRAKHTTSARTPMNEVTNESDAMLKKPSLYAIKALFLMLCCSHSIFAQDHSSSLNIAIRNGDHLQVKALLAHGANLNAPDADGTTSLMYAVVNAETECVKLLLDKGADPNLSNKAGATALMWAVNDLKKVKLLLAKSANVNAVSKDGKSPLLVAVRLPNATAVVQALLAKGADVNQADKDGFTPLIRAGVSGNLELVQLLLAKGADPKAKTKNEMTYLKALASSDNPAAVRWALAQGVDVKDPKEEFLFTPAMTGDLAHARLLLDQGATPNPPDEDGFTPLMVAVITEDSSLEMVKLLLEKGADPKAKTKGGLTALTFAKRKGWTEAIALLTQAGATE